jgi:phenylalanine-4-hydroxylase
VEFESCYQAKKANDAGYVEYSDEENSTWQTLYQRQMKILPGRACDEHIAGLEKLGLSSTEIPQLPDVNLKLKAISGWTVKAVDALISHEEFFTLLANRIFPAATFIRVPAELDYIKEPDIFHELFGHCPMLTQIEFADFTQKYAETVLNMSQEDWPLMQRLFWFTVEFGLIRTQKGIRAYGGGILSSIGETQYCVESPLPLRIDYQALSILRTPYRIDMMQPIYYVINDYSQLYDSLCDDIVDTIKLCRELGEFPPVFEVEKGNPSIHVQVC